MRGFTLIEMLVVLTVVGVVASMTLPDLTPVVRRTELRGALGESVALVERARREARASGRCMRVRGVAGELLLERAAGARCTGAVFQGTQRVRARSGITIALDAGSPTIVMTPAGRLFGNGDLNIEDDGARIVLRSATFPNQVSYVGVTAAGLVCSRVVSALPPFSPGTVCFQDPPFFGATETLAGETELGNDGDVAALEGVAGVENVVAEPGAPPPPPPLAAPVEAPAEVTVSDASGFEPIESAVPGFSGDGLLAQGSGIEG